MEDSTADDTCEAHLEDCCSSTLSLTPPAAGALPSPHALPVGGGEGSLLLGALPLVVLRATRGDGAAAAGVGDSRPATFQDLTCGAWNQRQHCECLMMDLGLSKDVIFAAGINA